MEQKRANGVSYPRTGKRGVPQQFPRRLYNMLEAETQLSQSTSESLISWSPSGKAFRIEDVTLFSTLILPKYFRTNKFSSFQRNLNLYGFSKVRRGPDTDMYAHPSFLRGQPDLLSELKKCKSAADRKRQAKSLNHEMTTSAASLTMRNIMQASVSAHNAALPHDTRAVSPSCSSEEETGQRLRNPQLPYYAQQNHQLQYQYTPPHLYNNSGINQPRMPQSSINLQNNSKSLQNSSPTQPSGKLDLLALAINCLSDGRK